jgi:hypothetical protein
MGKRAYINDGNDNWIPLVSSLPNLDAYATKDYVDINLLDYATQEELENIDLSEYLTIDSASSTYLTKVSASTNYVSQSYFDDAEVLPIKINLQEISSNYLIDSGYNGFSAGKIKINDGITVTISQDSSWSLV